MRTIRVMLLLTAACCADDAFGTWKMIQGRSTFAGDSHAKSITVRIESHAKGEVFTLDRIDGDGRTTTASSILYLDGRPRDFQDNECSGSQLSRRVDNRTVEILRTCVGGQKTRLVRRLATPKELILEITEQHSGGDSFERRLVLEKQSRAGTTQDR